MIVGGIEYVQNTTQMSQSSFLGSFTHYGVKYTQEDYLPFNENPIVVGLNPEGAVIACGDVTVNVNSTECFIYTGSSWIETFGLFPIRYIS